MGPGKMLEECCDLIQSFDAKVMTVDAHAMEQLGDTDAEDAAPHKVFMQQVLYGCVRYKKPLRTFLLNFYHDNAGKILRSDYTLFQVLCYLAVFRLRELGFEQFRRFVSSQEPGKMHIFLEYLWRPENMAGPIMQDWLTVFDREYIERELWAGLEGERKSVEELCETLAKKAFGAAKAKAEKEKRDPRELKNRKKQTVPVSPRITRPKPRPVPEPIKIAQHVEAKSVDEVRAYLKKSKDVRDIEAAGRARRMEVKQRTAAKYKASDEFKFHEAESNIEKVRAEVEAIREAELQFDSFRARKAPKFPETSENAVKLNVASVLREDALYKDKQIQEAKMIKKYESELRDANDYFRWKTEMEKKDHAAKMAEVERRRQESHQSAIDAAQAQERHKEENHALASRIKAAGRAMTEQHEAEKELVLMTNKQLVTEVRAVEKTAPRLAEKAVHRQRQHARKGVQKDLKERLARKEKEDEEERKVRDDRVRQIRALEKVLHKAETGAEKYDPTTTMNQGMLEDMSLVELKERLALVKARAAEAEVYKRSVIQRDKKEKADDVQVRMQNIRRVRQAASSSNKQARQRRLRKEAEEKEKLRLERNEGNKALAVRVLAKRERQMAEAQSLIDEEARVKNQQMFLGAAKAQMEEKHFDQLLFGAERELREKQTRARVEQKAYEDTMAHAQDVRRQLKRQERAATKRFYRQQDGVVREQRVELAEKKTLELEAKKAAMRAARVRDKALRGVLEAAQPYAALQAKKSLQRGLAATKRREEREREQRAAAAMESGLRLDTGGSSFAGSAAESFGADFTERGMATGAGTGTMAGSRTLDSTGGGGSRAMTGARA